MHIHIFAEYDELSRAAAARVVEVLNTRKHPVLGLATGSTPMGVYRELITAVRRGRVSFRQAHIFHLDEFHPLAPDHPASFQHYLKIHLLDRIDCPLERIHFLDGLTGDPAAEAARYEETIRRAGGIDVQLLGIGPNGHVAFNEPGSLRNSRTRRVRLHEVSRQHNRAAFAAAGEEVPRHALTLGIGTIMEAGELLLLAAGSEKAGIVARALTGPVGPDIPTTLLREHDRLSVYLERAAAVDLEDARDAEAAAGLDEAPGLCGVEVSGREHPT